MGFIGTLGMDILSKAAGAAMGGIAAKAADKRQLEQQKKLQAMQIQGNKEMTDYVKMKDYEMWQKTSYPGQLEMLKKAGLNPGLMYGMGGGGGTTTGGSGSVSGAAAPSGGGEVVAGMGMMNVAQLALLKAQKENIEADTANKQADTGNKGADTDLKREQTENEVLKQVINDYAGREAKDVYERVTAPGRAVQAKTYMDELEARQGVAGTIYELWAEGKLKEKSVAEIEKLVLENLQTKAKTEQTRAEIRNINKTFDLLEENLKGAKLDNVIKDLEAKLQTQTGIDRSSPGWLKILGRLFVGLTN